MNYRELFMNYYFSAYFCGICETFPLARAGKTSMPLRYQQDILRFVKIRFIRVRA